MLCFDATLQSDFEVYRANISIRCLLQVCRNLLDQSRIMTDTFVARSASSAQLTVISLTVAINVVVDLISILIGSRRLEALDDNILVVWNHLTRAFTNLSD